MLVNYYLILCFGDYIRDNIMYMFKLKADSSAGRWIVRENMSVAGQKDIII